MYIMTPEPTTTVYFINPFHQSVSTCVSPLSLLGNGSVNTFTWQWIHATITELLDMHVWDCLCIPLYLLIQTSLIWNLR
jgi:hypothetical protein